jgi:hypothetical protein
MKTKGGLENEGDESAAVFAFSIGSGLVELRTVHLWKS